MKIRCILGKEDDLYVAASLDFGLAAQAYTESEAIHKLEEQVDSYLEDISELGEADWKRMLHRRGPLAWYYIYYKIRLKDMLCRLHSRDEGFVIERHPHHA